MMYCTDMICQKILGNQFQIIENYISCLLIHTLKQTTSVTIINMPGTDKT